MHLMTAPPANDDGLSPSDIALVSRLACDDTTAADELYARYARPVFSLACRIARDGGIAEEATQDVFVQAWREASRYDPARGTVRGWLLMMARARTLDRLRSRQRRISWQTPLDAAPEVDVPNTGISLESTLAAAEDAGRVNAALAILPETDRRLIDLAYFDGLSQSEIAARLAVPLGTVKTHTRRVMRLMRRAIAEEPARPFEWSGSRLPSVASGAPLRDANVVIVDDDIDTLRLLTLVLERAGACVLPASSAAQARRRLAVVWPDVLVTDLEMPAEDGYSLLRGFREIGRDRQVPAVAFTAHDTAEDHDRAQRAGFCLHLSKPIRPSLLVERLAEVLGQHRLRVPELGLS